MSEIAAALIAQRKAMRFPVPVTFCEETNLGAYGESYPRVTLRVLTEPSSVTAVVPFKVEETVTFAAEEAAVKDLDRLVNVLFAGCNERPYFGYDATIHKMTFGGARYGTGAANERKAVITWTGLASWRRR